MKRFFKLMITIILAVINVFPFQAFASEEIIPEWQDAVLSREQFEAIFEKAENTSARATGLIYVGGLGIDKNGSELTMAGKILCDPDVVKCGYKEIVIERRPAGTLDYEKYATYRDLYSDVCVYYLAKSVIVPTGYYYRISYTMYAKKNIFSTEKIEGTSNVVWI